MSLVEDLMCEMQDLQNANKELQLQLKELVTDVSYFIIFMLSGLLQ